MSKRRKTSPAGSFTIDNGPAISDAPATPTRASYKSPTKASLARSHPSILTRSPGTRISGRRNSVLTDQPLALPSKGSTGPYGNAKQKSGSLQQKRASPQGQSGQDDSPLPPTPSELGMSPSQKRARGLARSSPSSRGSRRSGLSSVQNSTSSPLKRPRKEKQTNRQEARSATLTGGGPGQMADEVIDSEVSAVEYPTDAQEESTQSAEVTAKAEELKQLKAQLLELQAENSQLDDFITDWDGEAALPPWVEAFLTQPDADDGDYGGKLKNPVALGADPLPFLQSFAPGDLALTYQTTTGKESNRHHIQTHNLLVSAPPPWPPHLFSYKFRVTCDTDKRRIQRLQAFPPNHQKFALPREVKRWIDDRLKHPLYQFDCGTLIWGMGMWWKQQVARAQFLKHIDSTMRVGTAGGGHIPFRPNAVVAPEDVRWLLPYLSKSFLELIPAADYSNKASTAAERRTRYVGLLFKWDIELDWCGGVQSKIGLTGEKLGALGSQDLQKVFEELRKRSGIDMAVRHVMDLCGKTEKKGKARRP